MRLLYVWIKELCNCKVEGDFAFSKKLSVFYDPAEEMLKLSENETYISEFFGDTIEDIAVLAGENGMGKTTMCKKLLSILKGEKEYGSSYVVVFENGKRIDIYCKDMNIYELEFNGEQWSFENGPYQNNRYHVFLHEPKDAIDSRMLPLLVTNGFPRSDLETQYDAEKDRYYYRSPAYLIKNAGEWAKNDYGSEWDGYLHNNSYVYALEQTKDPIFEYQAYQNKLVIEGFFATKAIPLMSEFSFFKEFNMGVRPFGEDQKTRNLCSELDLELNELKRARRGILEHCYFTLLREAYMYCGLEKKEEDEKKPCPNAIGRLLIDRIRKWKDPSFSGSLIDNDFNQKLQEEIRDQVTKSIKNNPNIRSRSVDQWDWYRQFTKVTKQLNSWKNDPKKMRLFQYSIDRYKFDSPEGKELLEFYRERLEEDESFWKRAIGFNIKSGSTGEIAMVNLFAYIMDLIYSWKNTPGKEIFLMIDEIDINIHPKWQQEIISCTIDFLKQQFPEHRFQLLITTHSPICLSDIPAEKILKLKRCEGENTIQVFPCGEPTFGANIYDLFYDGFFMKEGTIGKFAQKKIDGAVALLLGSNVSDIGDETSYIVKSVGESMVREQMEDLLVNLPRTQR